MNHAANANAHAMDGFDVWFFGGTPGPDDEPHSCTLMISEKQSIDQEDARIPAFAHRCNCGKPIAALRQATRNPALALHA